MGRFAPVILEVVQIVKAQTPSDVDSMGCSHNNIQGDNYREWCVDCGETLHDFEQEQTSANPDCTNLCVMCGINEQNELVKSSANKGLCSECNRKHPVLCSSGKQDACNACKTTDNQNYTNKEEKK